MHVDGFPVMFLFVRINDFDVKGGNRIVLSYNDPRLLFMSGTNVDSAISIIAFPWSSLVK